MEKKIFEKRYEKELYLFVRSSVNENHSLLRDIDRLLGMFVCHIAKRDFSTTVMNLEDISKNQVSKDILELVVDIFYDKYYNTVYALADTQVKEKAHGMFFRRDIKSLLDLIISCETKMGKSVSRVTYSNGDTVAHLIAKDGDMTQMGVLASIDPDTLLIKNNAKFAALNVAIRNPKCIGYFFLVLPEHIFNENIREFVSSDVAYKEVLLTYHKLPVCADILLRMSLKEDKKKREMEQEIAAKEEIERKINKEKAEKEKVLFDVLSEQECVISTPDVTLSISPFSKDICFSCHNPYVVPSMLDSLRIRYHKEPVFNDFSHQLPENYYDRMEAVDDQYDRYSRPQFGDTRFYDPSEFIQAAHQLDDLLVLPLFSSFDPDKFLRYYIKNFPRSFFDVRFFKKICLIFFFRDNVREKFSLDVSHFSPTVFDFFFDRVSTPIIETIFFLTSDDNGLSSFGKFLISYGLTPSYSIFIEQRHHDIMKLQTKEVRNNASLLSYVPSSVFLIEHGFATFTSVPKDPNSVTDRFFRMYMKCPMEVRNLISRSNEPISDFFLDPFIPKDFLAPDPMHPEFYSGVTFDVSYIIYYFHGFSNSVVNVKKTAINAVETSIEMFYLRDNFPDSGNKMIGDERDLKKYFTRKCKLNNMCRCNEIHVRDYNKLRIVLKCNGNVPGSIDRQKRDVFFNYFGSMDDYDPHSWIFIDTRFEE